MMAYRWPLHPPLYPHESLSSWLERLAGAYGYCSDAVLLEDLGFPDLSSEDLDRNPPPLLLERLAERCGVPAECVSTMTIPGWRSLFGADLPLGPDRYATYVRDHAVLYPRSLHPSSVVQSWCPWLDAERFLRGVACRACLDEGPEPYRRLSWRMAWMASCPVHGLLLENLLVLGGRIVSEPNEVPVPAPPEIRMIDGITWRAIADGTVSLPGGQIAGATWLRLLRTLLEELSQPTTFLQGYITTAPKIWRSLGLGTRQGLGNAHLPFERLSARRQFLLMRAAGAAVTLFQQQVITRGGEDAVFFLPPRAVKRKLPEKKRTRAQIRYDTYVSAWKQVHTALQEVVATQDQQKAAPGGGTFVREIMPTAIRTDDIDRLLRESP
jgi:TniQ